MNSASQWRQEFARRIAPAYAANSNVAAIVLGGSSARGHADRYSDIEIGVFWHQPPTEAERQDAVARSGADLQRLYPYDAEWEVWEDNLMVGRAAADTPKSGLLAEVVHYTTEFMQRTLDAVLQQHDPDENKQLMIAGVLEGIPLHNPQMIAQWQTRAAVYPLELTQAVIQRHAVIDHFWRWRMWLDRGPNLMMLYQSYAQVQHKLLHILLGINHVYYFGFKWIDVIVERLPLAPADLGLRLQMVYQVAPAEGAQILSALVEETYDLVEQHCPQIDIDWLRRVFRYQRPIWDAAPPTA
jgi:predicted nucleotidyltransferase